MSGTFLYRIYDEANRLLYVGISKTFAARLAQHHETQPWADQIARVECKPYKDRASAERAEIEAIRSEKPIHNKQHATKPSIIEQLPQQWESLSIDERDQVVHILKVMSTTHFEESDGRGERMQGVMARLALTLDSSKPFPTDFR